MEKKIKVIRPISELQDTKPTLKVCAYCRVSTEQEDQNNSYETQKQYYEQYIRSNPEWEFAGIYADKGSGRSTKNRNAFNEMLDDCEDNKIDLIICKSISRFARNTLDAIKIARELKDDGIYIIFEKENINTEKNESELAFNLLASFAQMESESISKNVKQGIRNRFKDGEYSIGTPSYGYIKKSKDKLEINEAQAEVVRLIFKMYIDGYSSKKIANYLNENKVDPNRNWDSRRIPRDIIKNKTYIGTRVLQKSVIIGTEKHINKGHAPTYELENEQPAIVSKEDFEKANEILNEKKLARGLDKAKEKQRTVFTGKLICGDCGNTLVKIKSKSYKKQSHVCTNCRKNKTTTNHIKEQFIELRNELVKNYEQLLMTNEMSNSNSSDEHKHAIEYKQKLDEIIRQKEIIYRLKEDRIIDSAIFIEKNNKIDTDIKKLEEEMYSLNFNNVDRNRRKLIKYIKKLSETKKVETIFQENEFGTIIDKIYVKGDIITYLIKTGLELEYRNNYETKVVIKYGYKKVNGKYIVDDYEKNVVSYMFSQYVKGKSSIEISIDLNEKGIKTSKGKPTWHNSVIIGYLKNKNYLGNDIFPRIIDDEQFIKVQEILKEKNINKNWSRRKKNI